MAYLVGLVVILWVVFKDFRLLHIDKILHEIVDLEFLSPLLTVEEPSQNSAQPRNPKINCSSE